MKKIWVVLALWAATASATVTSTNPTTSCVCTGAQITCPVPYPFLQASDLTVTVDTPTTSAPLALGTDYDVSGGTPTGAVTLTATGAGKCTSETLNVTRIIELKQPTTLRTQGPYEPKVIEKGLDRATMGLQQIDLYADKLNEAVCALEDWYGTKVGPPGAAGPSGPSGPSGPGPTLTALRAGEGPCQYSISGVFGTRIESNGVTSYACTGGPGATGQTGSTGPVDTTALTLAGSKTRVFYRTTAPTSPDNGYTIVDGDLWFDTTTFTDSDGLTKTKYDMYRWSGGSWVAITVPGKTGGPLIPGGQIAGQSVTAAQLADGSVNAAKLVAGSIDLSLAAPDLLSAIGTAGVIGPGAISGTMIADNAITTPKLTANVITTNLLAADAVVASKIAAGEIGATHLAANSVIAGKIATDAVDANQIKANAVTSGKVAAGTITASEIATGAIVTDKLGANAVTADKIDVNSLNAANSIRVGYSQVSGLGSLATKSSVSAASDITGLGGLALKSTINDPDVTAIDAGKITTGYINANRIEAGSISANKINVADLNAAHTITVGTSQVSGLGALATKNTVVVGTDVTGLGTLATRNSVVAGTSDITGLGSLALKSTVNNADVTSIDAGKITTGYISTNRIDALTITGNQIAAGAITSDKIDVGALQTSNYCDQTICGAPVAGLPVAGAKLDKSGTSIKVAEGGLQVGRTKLEEMIQGIRFRVGSTNWDVTKAWGSTGISVARGWGTTSGHSCIWVDFPANASGRAAARVIQVTIEFDTSLSGTYGPFHGAVLGWTSSLTGADSYCIGLNSGAGWYGGSNAPLMWVNVTSLQVNPWF